MTPQAPLAQIDRALARARDGRSLDLAEAAALLQARGDRFIALCEHASRVADSGPRAAGADGIRRVTYSPKVFIPLTRLCRDRCHYCTFATHPAAVLAAYLSPDEVLAIARAGAELGCTEALFTLGDRPEDRWPAAREWLDAAGYDSTLDYLRAMAVRVLEDTGLLPHLNPGVMSWAELSRLKPVSPSMGMMLETTSQLVFTDGAHKGSPDKDPAVRLAVIDDAGRLAVPFTTGILVGIGETVTDRAESLLALRTSALTFGHIQEVIVQNFRAKPGTAMAAMPDAGFEEFLATVAVARLLLPGNISIQSPPNLVGWDETDHDAAAECLALLGAGVDDWGGVSPLTPDHVNPERPWPHLDQLAERTASAGFELTARLTVHPRYVRAGEPWLDPRIVGHVAALADPATGLARPGVKPAPLPWQASDLVDLTAGSGRTELHIEVDTTGRTDDRRGDFDEVYGDWAQIAARAGRSTLSSAPPRVEVDVSTALALAERDPAALLLTEHRDAALALLHSDGAELDALCALADQVRADVVGETVTYVVTRNINASNVCYTGCRFCAFAQRRSDADAYALSVEQVGARVRAAWDAGATEICLQSGIDPAWPATAYLDLARAVKQAAPGIHLHAFSPMELANGAARAGVSIEEWLVAVREAGVDSIPGTAAEILDEDVRWVLTRGKLPASEWVRVVQAAHAVGLRSSSTMMFGHVDTPAHWLGHLQVLAGVQDRAVEFGVGGFTEFVGLPFVHTSSPIYLAGLARPGPSARELRVVHAFARLALHGRVDHIQCSWVKAGDDGCVRLLAGGCDDLGGTLMEETISRMAGSSHGSRRTTAELEAIAAAAGRPALQRTTVYGRAADERVVLARRTGGVPKDLAGNTTVGLDEQGMTRV